MIRIAMVEDHPIVQAGIARIVAGSPNISLVATVERVEELRLPPEAVEVVLVDLHLPGGFQGVAAVSHLAHRGHRVMVVTGGETSLEDVADAMAAGARGYLTKEARPAKYIDGIAAVAEGRVYLAAQLAAYVCEQDQALDPSDPNKLTVREAEVAGLIVEGYTNAEISQILKVSPRTVDGHVENVKQKLCESRRVRVAMKLKEMGYEAPERHRWSPE